MVPADFQGREPEEQGAMVPLAHRLPVAAGAAPAILAAHPEEPIPPPAEEAAAMQSLGT